MRRRSPNFLSQVPRLPVASPRLVRHRSQPRVSPVRISSADLRRFSVIRAFCRRWSLASAFRVLTSCVPGPHFFGRPATLFGHPCILPSLVPSQCVSGPHLVCPRSAFLRPTCDAFPLPVHSAVAGPKPVRSGSSPRVSPVRISSADLRHFSATSAFCRRWSQGKVRTCNATATDR